MGSHRRRVRIKRLGGKCGAYPSSSGSIHSSRAVTIGLCISLFKHVVKESGWGRCEGDEGMHLISAGTDDDDG